MQTETGRHPLPGWDVTAEKIVRAVEKIVEHSAPVRVIAFGSRARGVFRPDSDLDLAVIVQGAADGTPFGAKPPIQKRPAGLTFEMPVDVLLITEQRQAFMKHSVVSVEHQIAKEGIVLYDQAVGSIDHRVAVSLAR